MEYGIGELIK